MTLFENRRHAGLKLSKYLQNKVEIDKVIVPFPEASDIGIEVAEALESRVELRLTGFIASSDPPYANIGAVADDGTLWIEDSLRREMNVSRGHVENIARIKSNALQKKLDELQQKKGDLKGESVLIASDGLSSGFREAAMAGSALKAGAENIYVAAPVKSEKMMANIEKVAEKTFFIHQVPFLSSSDACYSEDSSENSASFKLA